MEKIIGILDYGMGNINSVHNSLIHLGYEAMTVKTAQQIEQCSHLIIPGVGAYSKAMVNIRALNVQVPIHDHVKAGKPLLGICLGMQILSDTGDEGVKTNGLGLISGAVQLLELDPLPVPHVGWNSLEFYCDHPIFAKLKRHVDFYFVHSYFFNAIDKDQIAAVTDYGKQFPAIVVKDNIVGIQFHPEKSQDNGLLLIENFCEWNGQC